MADDEQDVLELIGLYEDQDEDTIWARRVAWANEGLTPDDEEEWTDTREGSFFHVTTIGGVREDARIYDLMGTEVVAASHPLYAWESYLDAHAEVQRLIRTAAVPATGEVTFTGSNGTVIPIGTEVGTEPTEPEADAPVYEVTAAGTIAAGTVTVPVRAVEGGKAGDVSAGAVVAILTDVAGANTVTNADAIIGGADTETDEELRDRLLAVYGGGGGWNVAAFKVAALAFGRGIGRVTVIPLWNGPGTVKVIIATADGDPVAPDVVTDLQAFLDPIVQQGAGEVMVGLAVTVQTNATVPVVIAMTIEFEPGFSLDGGGNTVPCRDLITLREQSYVNAVEPDGEVVLAQVSGQVTTIRGVHDVGGVTINGVAANLAIAENQAPELTVPLTLAEGPV